MGVLKQTGKRLAELAAAVAVLPTWLVCLVSRAALGRDRACQSIGQRASRWPGVWGEYRRRVLLRRVLARVGRDVVVSFGSVITKSSAELANGVYIGAYCLLGNVSIGEETLLADGVQVPSGAHQHGIDDLDVPIRQQQGTVERITIGRDCWIGSGAIILAAVGDHCIVAAGSVVTKPVADYQVVAGVPARLVADRREQKVQA